MMRTPISGRPTFARLTTWGICAAMVAGAVAIWPAPQARGATTQAPALPTQEAATNGRHQMQPMPAKAFPLTLVIAEGTNASYRVREQFVGINFPSDAVGSSSAVTGQIAFNQDASIDTANSKLEFDLRTLKSDQSMRDGFIQRNTLETDQYPMAVFVPKTITGMPNPLAGQFGFELSGDMTVHGVTAPITWRGVATVDRRSGAVAGRAETSFTFETFHLKPPKIMRLLSVSDSIGLEMEFRTTVK